MLTAKPVIVSKPGLAGTVIGPLKVTDTPDAPRRITLPNDLVDVVVFRKFNAPDARVPGIDPVEVTVFGCAEDVEVIIRADTWRMLGFGLPVTPKI
jgi:hypothetical protein